MKYNQAESTSNSTLEHHNHATIRFATSADVSAMVALSDQERRAYEHAQPKFWRRAENANEKQAKFFQWLLFRGIHLLLVAEANHKVIGFVIGQVIAAPHVYEPKGMTLKIDDFCVENPTLWNTIGQQLLDELKIHARQDRVIQTLIVCGQHDEPKKEFLQTMNLSVVSEWYVGKV